jgi:hypothetical protein
MWWLISPLLLQNGGSERRFHCDSYRNFSPSAISFLGEFRGEKRSASAHSSRKSGK